MIRVEMHRKVKDIKFSVCGHAGYAMAEGLPAGCDIVCAAASVLADTYIERMYELRKQGIVSLSDGEVVRKKGSVWVMVRKECRTDRTELEATVRTVAAGYALLADRYPQYVRLEADEWMLGGTDRGVGEICRNPLYCMDKDK